MAEGSSNLSPASLEALFPSTAWRVGEDYVGLGQVDRLVRSGLRIAGEVRGRRADYWALVTPAGPRCSSCHSPCRHAAAIAVAWIRDPASFVDLDGLVQAYLSSPSAVPIVEGLLADDVLKALQGFTEGVFIPPFDPEESLLRLTSLSPEAQVEAIERLARLEPPSPALLARALTLVPRVPFARMARLLLEAPETAFEPLAVWLLGHVGEGDLSVFLNQVQALALGYPEGARVVLERASRLLVRLPGSDKALAWLLEDPQATAPLAAEVARLLLAAHRPREALHNLDRALLTAPETERVPLLRLAIQAAELSGSPREGPLRLRALSEGDWEEASSLAERHRDLLQEEGPPLLRRDPPPPPDTVAALALALGENQLAFSTARTHPLNGELLQKVQACALRVGQDPTDFIRSHLTPREKRRLRGHRVRRRRPKSDRNSSP